jgi:chaperonin GroES
MILQLNGDRAILLPDDGEQRTSSGLVLPRSVSDKEKGRVPINRGLVLEIGPGRVTDQGVRIPPRCKAGDIVWYSVLLGVEFRWKGRTLLVCEEGDFFGVETDGDWELPVSLPRPEEPLVATRVLA